MKGILVFGNLQLDVLCRPVSSLPVPGELRKIEQVDFALSGNGGNLAIALARLGMPVSLVGYSGADMVGEQFRAILAAEGVNIDRLAQHRSLGTGTSFVAISPSGEKSVLFVNGANEAFELDDVPDDWLEGAQFVAVCSIFVLPQFTGDAVGRLFARARRCGATTVLNTCWDSEGRGLSFLHPALAETDYFILNHDEGRQLTFCDQPENILDMLASHTSGTIVLTLGSAGCCFHANGAFICVPAVPVAATDTTGAGDAFIAGFIAGLTHGLSLEACARLGCRVAAFAVTGPGAYPRIPRAKDATELLQEVTS